MAALRTNWTQCYIHRHGFSRGMSSTDSAHICNSCGSSYYRSVFASRSKAPRYCHYTVQSATLRYNCTSGMRVGAKAVECLSLLKEARAVHFYRDYPKVHHLFIVCLLYLNELIQALIQVLFRTFMSSPFLTLRNMNLAIAASARSTTSSYSGA